VSIAGELAGVPARVLIVDDERMNRDLLELVLAPEGFPLETAASGEGALAMIQRQPPDLVLLDVLMPGMNGYEVTKEIKRNVATLDIPVIMITALDDRQARMLGLSAGAEDFLSKPVDPAEVRVRVRNLLRLRSAIAEAREARLVAEQANRAKTAFLRAMSHELRTPLNAISGYAQLLSEGIRGPVNEAQAKDLGRITRASAYLFRLISDVLLMARLERARPPRREDIALGPVFEEIDDLCALQAAAAGVSLSIVRCADAVSVSADAERLRQILLNLVTNAIKFTPRGGGIHITCEHDDRTVQIHVADTGVGVQRDDIDRVFEAFVQIDRHLTMEAQQGVGLGLSISRQLARAMHGDLTLESTPGVGSTFTLVVPVAGRLDGLGPEPDDHPVTQGAVH
jgi:signal transduction histidine kinase